jgi:hypothetical protein
LDSSDAHSWTFVAGGENSKNLGRAEGSGPMERVWEARVEGGARRFPPSGWLQR